ncbi:sodium:proton antiporter [Ensifer adhaerens]|uniref:Na(+)/H(+) antiporter NhaA n=1 Tax=Ensifer adhaerens TaxID=106592 RepID=A0A0L8BLR1_ENSAD|nr:Na+/H+ antiporter NhaA [Ensifer adhaerens]KOF15606.1 sodium:proton antiporter [Ensifer adhaerens]
MKDSLSQLPREPADRLTKPFMRFLLIEATAGIILLLSTLLALGLANTAWSSSFLALWEMPAGVRVGDIEIYRSLKHWINDGLMTLFFFVIALELKRELVLGELRNPRIAALPIAAALGGMAVPAGLFSLLVGGGPGASGWGTVMSTDTAFVIGCLAVLGSRVPGSLRLFLLSLAIFDDVGAVLIVAIGYGEPLNWVALGTAGLGLAVVAGIARLGIRSIPVYFAIGGGIWLAFDTSGVHATLAGVILGLMTPARRWVSDTRLNAILDRVIAHPPGDHWSRDTVARSDLHRADVATREALSPIERLEIALHPWVAFVIMPFFALSNAGVPIGDANFDIPLTIAIFAAFVVGKPVGIVLFSFLAVKLRFGTRPDELSWSLLAAGSLLAGIGFTMALFIADLAFEPELLNSVKLGVLGASVISAALGLLALTLLTSPGRR